MSKTQIKIIGKVEINEYTNDSADIFWQDDVEQTYSFLIDVLNQFIGKKVCVIIKEME